MIYLNENIKKLRHEKGITQETLADFLGVTFQSVSKWERGESYPDITMLPAISSFFGVTTDELLGTEQSKKDVRIQEYIDEYERIYLKDTPKAFELMGKATKEFPGEFRLLIRYMLALMSTKGSIYDNPKLIYNEMVSLNENIQNYCKQDSIKIKAKRLMGTYYKTLSYTEKDDSYIEKMEEINKDLPVMRDSRDYTATHMYPPGEKHDKACRTAIEEILFLLDGATVNYCYYNEEFSPEFRIEAAKIIQTILNAVYTDGNYGENWHTVVYNYGHLGYWYFQTGDETKALENLRKCAELSVKYDAMPKETEHNSLLLKGKIFEKRERGRTMCQRMKRHFLVNYPLSDEFKESEEFRKIIEIFG